MNKYQEALDRLKKITNVPSIFIDVTVNELTETFEELINKQTNHKTLEELGYDEISRDKVEFTFKKMGDYDAKFLYIYPDGSFETEERIISYKLAKAIELKMIELGCVDNEH